MPLYKYIIFGSFSFCLINIYMLGPHSTFSKLTTGLVFVELRQVISSFLSILIFPLLLPSHPSSPFGVPLLPLPVMLLSLLSLFFLCLLVPGVAVVRTDGSSHAQLEGNDIFRKEQKT